MDRYQALLHPDGFRCLLAANACADADDATGMVHGFATKSIQAHVPHMLL